MCWLRCEFLRVPDYANGTCRAELQAEAHRPSCRRQHGSAPNNETYTPRAHTMWQTLFTAAGSC